VSPLPGQEVIVGVGSDLVTGSAPTFSTSNLNLVSSHVIGVVGAINTTGASLTLDGLTGVFSSAGSLIQSIDVQTGSGTDFVGFASLSAVTAGQLLVAKGPLFNSPDTDTSVLAATDVRVRTSQE
jgi:hypothetical protein